jgi:hypothetical protein
MQVVISYYHVYVTVTKTNQTNHGISFPFKKNHGISYHVYVYPIPLRLRFLMSTKNTVMIPEQIVTDRGICAAGFITSNNVVY